MDIDFAIITDVCLPSSHIGGITNYIQKKIINLGAGNFVSHKLNFITNDTHFFLHRNYKGYEYFKYPEKTTVMHTSYNKWKICTLLHYLVNRKIKIFPS